MVVLKILYLLLINVFIVNITAADHSIDDEKSIGQKIISHNFTNKAANFGDAIGRILCSKDDKISKFAMIGMLTKLLEHPIGREIFSHQGLNGKNTAYIIKGDPSETTSLIRWLLYQAPAVLATRERFGIFQQQIESLLNSGSMSFVSVPCGVMDDLLSIKDVNKRNISLTGIDLDGKSLNLAGVSAEQKGLTCDFYKKDAFDLSYVYDKFDALISNGLNIYVADDAKVIDLYKEFFKSLRDGGTLITSFLTPPPLLGGNTWKNITDSDAIKQRILFQVVIGVKWQNFRTEETTRNQLIAAGFEDIKVIYDSRGMFPTVIAKKQP